MKNKNIHFITFISSVVFACAAYSMDDEPKTQETPCVVLPSVIEVSIQQVYEKKVELEESLKLFRNSCLCPECREKKVEPSSEIIIENEIDLNVKANSMVEKNELNYTDLGHLARLAIDFDSEYTMARLHSSEAGRQKENDCINFGRMECGILSLAVHHENLTFVEIILHSFRQPYMKSFWQKNNSSQLSSLWSDCSRKSFNPFFLAVECKNEKIFEHLISETFKQSLFGFYEKPITNDGWFFDLICFTVDCKNETAFKKMLWVVNTYSIHYDIVKLKPENWISIAWKTTTGKVPDSFFDSLEESKLLPSHIDIDKIKNYQRRRKALK